MAPIETHAAGAMLLPLVDLNRERREERRSVLRRSRRHLTAVLASVALAVTVPLPLTLQTLALHRECSKAQGQAAGVRKRLQSVTAASGELDAKISRWTRLVRSQQARQDWGATLPTLAACLPDDVSLLQVQISRKDRAAQIQLQGSAETMAGLRAFTAALARSPLFARVHLDETTAGRGGVTFQMAGPVSGAITDGAEPSAP